MGLIQATVSPNPAIDLSGKTVIVTGGNAGLGLECVRQFLVAKASKVIIACRTPAKGEAAREGLLKDPTVRKKNPKAEIIVMKLDMERYTSVVEFANAVKKTLPLLHVLLLNAGTGGLTYEQSPTGHEKVMQVNFLSNALLALELLPLLEETAAKGGAPTRMSWVGSRNHGSTSLAKNQSIQHESVLDHFDKKANFSAMSAYSDSKLLCVLFITELARRVPKEKVIINTMCPGMVKTGIPDSMPLWLRLPVNAVQAIRARTPEQGGWIILYATILAGPKSHGHYLHDKTPKP